MDLFAKLQSELSRIRDWQEKEATRDFMKQTILDFLYSEETGLPDSYSEDEIKSKSDMVYSHFLYQQQQGMTFTAL